MRLHEVKRGKKDSVIGFMKKGFDSYQQAMVDTHRDWALTIAWTRGHQNVDFNSKTRKWEQQRRRAWQARLITNLMLPVVKSKVAKGAINKPIWDVPPATPDPKDQDISKISTKVLEHYWQLSNMTQKLLQMLYFRSTTGNGIFKVGWKESSGKKIKKLNTADIDPELLETFKNEIGIDVIPEEIEIDEGDLLIDVTSPFNLSFDPLVTLMDNNEWGIETQLVSLDWVIGNFGNKWKDKLTEKQVTDRLIHPLMFNTGSEARMEKGILIHELFIKHGSLYPKGFHCLTAGDEFLKTPRDLPFDHGELPWVHFIENIDPLSLWGHSDAQQIRPEQARYNQVKSVIQDHINKVGRIPWLIPFGSVRSIANQPGENIIFKGPQAPAQAQPANLPSYIERTLFTSKQDIQDVASFHNVSQAQSEPGLQSGRAVLALQDADEAIEAPTREWFDISLAKTGYLALRLITQNVSSDQILQITGQFGQLETLTFTGNMLQGNSEQADYFKVRVKTYGRHQLTRAGREAHISTLIQLGQLRPGEHDQIIREMLNSGYTDMIAEKEESSRTRQYKELEFMMQKKQQIPVITGEDHGMHLDTIKRFLASGLREDADAESIQIIEQHYQEHLKMQAAELVQQQMILQGAIDAGRATGGRAATGQRQATGAGNGQQRTGQPTGVNRSDSVGGRG